MAWNPRQLLEKYCRAYHNDHGRGFDAITERERERLQRIGEVKPLPSCFESPPADGGSQRNDMPHTGFDDTQDPVMARLERLREDRARLLREARRQQTLCRCERIRLLRQLPRDIQQSLGFDFPSERLSVDQRRSEAPQTRQQVREDANRKFRAEDTVPTLSVPRRQEDGTTASSVESTSSSSSSPSPSSPAAATQPATLPPGGASQGRWDVSLELEGTMSWPSGQFDSAVPSHKGRAVAPSTPPRVSTAPASAEIPASDMPFAGGPPRRSPAEVSPPRPGPSTEARWLDLSGVGDLQGWLEEAARASGRPGGQ